MATYTSPQWDDEVYVPKAGELACGYGVVTLSSTVAKDDILQFFYLPQRAIPLRGLLQGEALETNATPALDMTVGTTGNTDKYGTLTNADDAVDAGHKEVGFLFHLGGEAIVSGAATGIFSALTAKEDVFGTVTGAATTAAAGVIACMIDYTTGRS